MVEVGCDVMSVVLWVGGGLWVLGMVCGWVCRVFWLDGFVLWRVCLCVVVFSGGDVGFWIVGSMCLRCWGWRVCGGGGGIVCEGDGVGGLCLCGFVAVGVCRLCSCVWLFVWLLWGYLGVGVVSRWYVLVSVL